MAAMLYVKRRTVHRNMYYSYVEYVKRRAVHRNIHTVRCTV